MYDFPEAHGEQYENHGINITDDDLNDLSQIDNLKDIFNSQTDKFIPTDIENIFDDVIANSNFGRLQDVPVKDAPSVYLYMRNEVTKRV